MKTWIERTRKDGLRLPDSWPGLGVSQRIKNILWTRGISDAALMDAFLSPQLRLLQQPEQWPGVEAAADFLARGLLDGQSLLVWGDYDVDGVTSTALVRQVLRFHNLPVHCHLPDRTSEGYGLNARSLEQLAEQGHKLLLTVDCGISDVAAVARARELGMGVVVTDHHLPPDVLPDAHVLCNPHLGDCPCSSLAGVGVAFFLMAALNARLAPHTGRKLDMRETLDLVALGTLADMAKLEGQNRILVKNGLLKIAEAKRPGISELKAVSGYAPLAVLGAGQVVFSLAPRINAAGRVAHADTALRLLCTDDAHEAATLAAELDSYNSARKQEEERICAEASAQAESQAHLPALVLSGENWNLGVIGIVASRMVELFHKPALIMCRDGDTMKGSGRSISAFDLHDGLSRCSEVLLAYGGHRMAAGFRLEPGRLEEFRTRFCEAVVEALGPDPIAPELYVDGTMDFAEASDFILLKELELLQPFGVGNPEPVFQSPPLLVKRRRVFGQERNHVNLELYDQGAGVSLHAKAWRQAKTLPQSLEGKTVRLAYSPGIDMYNGVASVDIKIKDMVIFD